SVLIGVGDQKDAVRRYCASQFPVQLNAFVGGEGRVERACSQQVRCSGRSGTLADNPGVITSRGGQAAPVTHFKSDGEGVLITANFTRDDFEISSSKVKRGVLIHKPVQDQSVIDNMVVLLYLRHAEIVVDIDIEVAVLVPYRT